ncbi:DNA-binding domain-containing protein [Treponema sp. HNW]|uniref:DNA-binding domain-containing protein n=1 Tax=Treponema sp. HNW TaxID=3116654 RepID=UPI003D0D22F8
MLKYCLRENLLTPDENDYMAQAADVRSFSLDEIIDLMMQKGSTLTKADTKAVLQVYGEVVSALIEDGSAVNTPLMNTALSITGTFIGAADSFDKKRHNIKLNLTPGLLLKNALTKIKCEKTQSTDTNPYITEVTDIVSGKVNELLSAGGVVQLVGARLKFDPKDASQGIFFVPEAGAEVRAAVIAENKPARLMAIIPADLKAGNWYIEVRTKIIGSSQKSKSLKTGRFDKPLTRT